MRRITTGDARLGEKMRELRKMRNVRQETLATERLHINVAKLSRFENGDQMPTREELTKFGQALKLSPKQWSDLRKVWDRVQQPEEVRRRLHGQKPEQIFKEQYACLYAADGPIAGSYASTSRIASTLADAYGGLRDKRVLDIGCGYGTTTVALAAFAPREIVAVDNSRYMVELLNKVLRSNDDIEVFMKSKGADHVLGDFFEQTLAHLQWMRASFQGSLFSRDPRNGTLKVFTQDGLQLDKEEIGGVDVVVGNHYLHWPVNQRIAQLQGDNPHLEHDHLLRQAVHDALRPIAALLPPKGIAVMLEPKDFVSFDTCPELDADLERHCQTEHPAFLTFHEAVGNILKADYGLEYTPAQTTSLFSAKALPGLVQSAGFKLREPVHIVELTYTCDPLDVFFVRLPMVMGNFDIPLEEKLKLAKRVRQLLGKTTIEEQLAKPVRVPSFYFVLERTEELNAA